MSSPSWIVSSREFGREVEWRASPVEGTGHTRVPVVTREFRFAATGTVGGQAGHDHVLDEGVLENARESAQKFLNELRICLMGEFSYWGTLS